MPPAHTPKQKQQIQQFVNFTQAKESVASKVCDDEFPFLVATFLIFCLFHFTMGAVQVLFCEVCGHDDGKVLWWLTTT